MNLNSKLDLFCGSRNRLKKGKGQNLYYGSKIPPFIYHTISCWLLIRSPSSQKKTNRMLLYESARWDQIFSWWNWRSLYDCMKKRWNETHLWVVEFQRPFSISMVLNFINRIHGCLKSTVGPSVEQSMKQITLMKFNNRMTRRNQTTLLKKKSNAWHKFQKKWVWIKDLEMKEEMKLSNRRRITGCEWRTKAMNAWMREGERVLFVLLGRLTPNIYGLGERSVL